VEVEAVGVEEEAAVAAEVEAAAAVGAVVGAEDPC
jgi:hypothetical protein